MAVRVSDKELWACAALVIKTHGNSAPLHVAERLGALALQGDADGIAVWKNIAAKIQALTMPSADRPKQ